MASRAPTLSARALPALLLVLSGCVGPAVPLASRSPASSARPGHAATDPARRARGPQADRAEQEVLLAQNLLLSKAPGSAERAVALYRSAAARGSAVAEYNLGILYEEGLGARADRPTAISWYRRAIANRESDVRELASSRLANLTAAPPGGATPE